MIVKNIPKSIKCKEILEKYNIQTKNINWLLNDEILITLIKTFLLNISIKYIDWKQIPNMNYSTSVINKFLLDLFDGCNFGRLIGEIDKISNSNDLNKMIKVYNLLKIVFGKNQTQQIRNNFNLKSQSNILGVQKSFNNLTNTIISNKIKYD